MLILHILNLMEPFEMINYPFYLQTSHIDVCLSVEYCQNQKQKFTLIQSEL